jgi:cytochrome P450
MPGARRPPAAPGGRPLVGHTLSFLREPLGALTRWGHTDDDVSGVRIAGRQFCLVSDPELTRQVLAGGDDYRKAEIVRDRLGTLQGGSLVLLEGDEWRERRALLGDGFTGSQIAGADQVTVERTVANVEQWPTEIRADEEMQSLALVILARALFGIELEGEDTPIHEAADAVLARLNPRNLAAFLPEWAPTPTNYRFRRAVARLHERIDDVVAASDGSPGSDLLSILLVAGVDDHRIRDELIALLFAGFDSTATALSTTLGLVADHEEIQTALRSELAAVLDGDRPTATDLEDLELLDSVVQEALRLYPPQYALFREPSSPVTLGGYRVDQGTTVVLSPWVCQRDPSHWQAPARFRPWRWQADCDRTEFAYFPYGVGPRTCLGRSLAAQTIRLVVAVVCQRRRLSLEGSLEVTAGPTLSPGQIELRAERDRH